MKCQFKLPFKNDVEQWEMLRERKRKIRERNKSAKTKKGKLNTRKNILTDDRKKTDEVT